MKNKNLIIKMIVVLVVLIILLGIILIFLKTQTNNKEDSNHQTDNFVDTVGTDVPYVLDERDSYQITKLINQYYDIIDKSRYYDKEGNDLSNENTTKEKIYNLLSENYITQNNVNINNIYENIDNIKNNVYFVPIKIKAITENDVYKFIAYGKLVNMNANTNEVKDKYIIINKDNNNNTFSVEPLNEEYKSIDDIITKDIKEIKIKDNNKIQTVSATEDQMQMERFNNFKLLNLKDSEFVYNNYINEEYKNKKFNTYEKYKDYLEKNNKRFSTMTADKYRARSYDEYIEYAYIDQNGNYYIFQENEIYDYKVVLDTYTIDLPEFTDKYNISNEQEKVGMNIEKFFTAINEKDYDYIYSILADSFKQRNYKTEQEFEKYAENTLFDYNYFTYSNYKKEGDLFVYSVKIKNKQDENVEEKNMTIVMQLKEGTDFVMSFSVE